MMHPEYIAGSLPANTELHYATRGSHIALQSSPPFLSLFDATLDAPRYRSILTRLHRCYTLIEREFDTRFHTLLADVAYMPRVPLLDADLETFGVECTLHKGLAPNPIPDQTAAIGVLYVIEGMAYGCRQVASALMRHDFARPANRFFRAYEAAAGEQWNRVCQHIDQHLASPADIVRASRFAEKTFALFHHTLADPVGVSAA